MRLRVNSRLLNEKVAQKGLSSWKLALKLRTSKKTVLKLLSADVKIQPRTAEKLIEAFGSDLVYVDEGEECTVEGDEE